jgi:hypothetical protein
LSRLELITDRVPDGICSGFGNVDDDADILGNGIVKPAKDTPIDH